MFRELLERFCFRHEIETFWSIGFFFFFIACQCRQEGMKSAVWPVCVSVCTFRCVLCLRGHAKIRVSLVGLKVVFLIKNTLQLVMY